MRDPDRRETDGLSTFHETSPAKLAHDLEQLDHLLAAGVEIAHADKVRAELRTLLDDVVQGGRGRGAGPGRARQS